MRTKRVIDLGSHTVHRPAERLGTCPICETHGALHRCVIADDDPDDAGLIEWWCWDCARTPIPTEEEILDDPITTLLVDAIVDGLRRFQPLSVDGH